MCIRDRLKAGLTDGRGLLITRDPKDRNFPAEKISPGGAEVISAITDFWQKGHGNIQQRANPGVPVPVSYTHLDVYKRQVNRCDENDRNVASLIILAQMLQHGITIYSRHHDIKKNQIRLW